MSTASPPMASSISKGLTYRLILSTTPRFSIRRLMAKKVSNLKLNRARKRGQILIALSLGLFASSKLIDECFQVPYQALILLIIASFACGMWGLWCLIVEGKAPRLKAKRKLGSPLSKRDAFASLSCYTLNLKCMTSPSCTTYSLPSWRSLPALRQPTSPPRST